MDNTSPLAHLRLFIGAFVQLTAKEWVAFENRLEWVAFEKGAVIEKANASISKLHFVLAGFARHYFTDAAGNEITIWISEPGGLSTDYAAFTKNKTTLYQIQALTPVSCLSIGRQQLNELYDGSKNFERMGRLINQEYLNSFIERNNSLISMQAKERYDLLFQQHPHWFNVVPLKHLASYLGVSTETLSRLRSNTY
jgi:CRP/FNR family transcriptional regulator, anaerobic regulatory protein